ncbi:MAG: hypothetical protein ACK41P_10550 [Asticcacaulis sp.]
MGKTDGLVYGGILGLCVLGGFIGLDAGGLAMVGLGAAGLWMGMMALVRGVDEDTDGEGNSPVATFTGLAARIRGVATVLISGFVGLAGLVMVLNLGGLFLGLAQGGGALIMTLLGVWIALDGMVRVLGSDEAREDAASFFQSVPGRIIGGLQLAFGSVLIVISLWFWLYGAALMRDLSRL